MLSAHKLMKTGEYDLITELDLYVDKIFSHCLQFCQNPRKNLGNLSAKLITTEMFFLFADTELFWRKNIHDNPMNFSIFISMGFSLLFFGKKNRSFTEPKHLKFTAFFFFLSGNFKKKPKYLKKHKIEESSQSNANIALVSFLPILSYWCILLYSKGKFLSIL